jgi:medium-chain acyl-[acyl-carrier-protein] hydrolase
MTTVPENPWINVYAPRPDARLRLLCFPHAGGSAAIFGRWPETLPDDIELWAIEYPGRGSRRTERALVRVHAMVAALLPALLPTLTAPYALFGQCMGAVVAFELARAVRRHGGPDPTALLVSSCRGPSLEPKRPPIHGMPDDEFVAAVCALNATPDHMLSTDAGRAVFLPPLRADFELVDTYAYRAGERLPCRVVTYGGVDDTDVAPGELDAWALETTAPLHRRTYPGDHSFFQSAAPLLVRDVAADARAAGDAPAGEAW